MKNISMMICAAILVCAALPAFASGTGENMGGLMTVVAEGPYDVGRNPALLPLMRKDRAIGFDISAQAYSTFSSTGSLGATFTPPPTVDLTSSSLEYGDPNTQKIAGAIAFAIKVTDAITVGIGILQQLQKDMPGMNMRLTTNLPSTLSSSSDSESLSSETDLFASAGMRLMGNLNLGIQLDGKSKYSSERESSVAYSGGNLDETGSKINELRDIQATVALGLLYHTDAMQIGFMVNSGTFNWHRQSYSENKSEKLSDPPNATGYNVSASTSWEGRYTDGPSLVLGGHYRLTQVMSVGAEAGYLFSRSYDVPAISMADTTLEEIDSEREVERVYFAGGGASFLIADGMTLAFGGRFLNYKLNQAEKNSKKTSDVEMEMKLLRIVLGLDWKVNENMNLVVFGAMDRTVAELGMSSAETAMSMNLSLENTTTAYSVGFGVTQYF
ncbi:MAG: hypothetical protein KBA61_05805 [Spirochaetes bacterium]|nr:hypothetical protein [Spirochaetota bacterium]